MFCLESLDCIDTLHASVSEIQEGEKLEIFRTDILVHATNVFCSALFSQGRVGNRDTKVFIYSCNTPHSTMRRTHAKMLAFNLIMLKGQRPAPTRCSFVAWSTDSTGYLDKRIMCCGSLVAGRAGSRVSFMVTGRSTRVWERKGKFNDEVITQGENNTY